MIGVFTFGLWRIQHLEAVIGAPVRWLFFPAIASARGLKAVAGWGKRSTTLKSRAFAKRYGLPFIALEDGFIRSVDLGAKGTEPLSLVIDDVGIYYDATKASRLEILIASIAMDENLRGEVTRAMSLIRKHRLSKYNHAPDVLLPPLTTQYSSRVLVVDQTREDMSVKMGGADERTFSQMLAAALAENPDADVIVKIHPDVLAGKKKGYLDKTHLESRVHLVTEDASPLSLLEQVDKVYVVTSQMGFEALMLDKPVVCFGQPWYAGWGLTEDRHADMPSLLQRRGVNRSVEELFAAAYLQYARYIEPATGKPGTIFDVIDWLVRNKSSGNRLRGNLYCIGMTAWKKAIVRPFLSAHSSRVHFIASAEHLEKKKLPTDARVVIWGCKDEQTVRTITERKKVPLWRMEDGFLRSVGLGSDLFRPISLVLDEGGIYYDSASESDLERMISGHVLGSEELDRAARFRHGFVSMRLSKYNLGRPSLIIDSKGKKVLLVPGQVEDDESVRRGSPAVNTNLALLQAVRSANPEAYILYKVHPDVASGNRKGAIDPLVLSTLANQCVDDANIIDCIQVSDEVHTMTSLAGFEALMHGRTVHCYGGPFYAGWGLTVDYMPLHHRQRRISLDELVYAAMIAYPSYILPGSREFASAEQAMAWLKEKMHNANDGLQASSVNGWLHRKQRKLAALTQLLRDEYRGRFS